MMPAYWLLTLPAPSPPSSPPPPPSEPASRWMKVLFSRSNRIGTPPVAGDVPSPGADRLREVTSLVDTNPPDPGPANWNVTPDPLIQVWSPPPVTGGAELPSSQVSPVPAAPAMESPLPWPIQRPTGGFHPGQEPDGHRSQSAAVSPLRSMPLALVPAGAVFWGAVPVILKTPGPKLYRPWLITIQSEVPGRIKYGSVRGGLQPPLPPLLATMSPFSTRCPQGVAFGVIAGDQFGEGLNPTSPP